MRLALVCALALLTTLGAAAIATPATAMPTCSPFYYLERGDVDGAKSCIDRDMSPCHYAVPHPCE